MDEFQTICMYVSLLIILVVLLAIWLYDFIKKHNNGGKHK